jgi:uncharacterized protein YuzE
LKGKQWITGILLGLVVVVFIVYELRVFQHTQGGGTEKNQSGKGENININEAIDEQIENNSKYPDKEAIVKKIIHGYQNFTTLEGEYEIYSPDPVPTVSKTRYAIDAEKQKSIMILYDHNEKISTVIWDEEQLKCMSFNETERTYTELELKKKEKNEKEDKELSKFERLYGSRATVERELFTAGGFAVSSEYVQYLMDFRNWDYHEGKCMDLPCYQLQGKITDSGDMNGPFEMQVEKNTGTVIGFKVFDDQKRVKYSLTTKMIKIDQPLDETLFTKGTAGYKKLEPMDPSDFDF